MGRLSGASEKSLAGEATLVEATEVTAVDEATEVVAASVGFPSPRTGKVFIVPATTIVPFTSPVLEEFTTGPWMP